MIADDEPVTLPFAVAVEAEDHTTDVNESPIGFNGVRVTGSPRWSGSAVIGDVLVTITTNGPAMVAAIEPCDDGALLDTRPPISNAPTRCVPAVSGAVLCESAHRDRLGAARCWSLSQWRSRPVDPRPVHEASMTARTPIVLNSTCRMIPG